MNTSLRSIALALAAPFAVAAVAQNVVTVTGTVSPCVGVSYPVHIVTNTVPLVDTTVYTDANCQYGFTFFPDSTQGTVVVETSCDGGITWVSAAGSWNPFFPTVTIDLACNGGGTCDACFSVEETGVPFVAQFTNCSTSNSPPISYAWSFPDGTVSALTNPTYDFTSLGPGLYFVCLVIMDGNNCSSTTCDSINVDIDGNINSNTFDCVPCVNIAPLTNGPGGAPIPWTLNAVSCSSGTLPISYSYQWSNGETTQSIVATQEGWYQVCLYMVDANGCQAATCDSAYVDSTGTVDPVVPTDCEAGFWVMQAYEMDSLNPGTAVPIPNLLWVWNLSSGVNTPVALDLITTMGSATATLPAGCNSAMIGAQVLGPNIPAGTTIISVSCPNVVMSNFATVTGTSTHVFTNTTGNFQFVWSWGDGTPNSTEPYPSHVYANGGPYNLCLTITNINGCTDTACDSISVDGNGFYTGMAANPEANGNGARNGFTVNVLNELPVTGINDRPVEEPTLAWPNPVEDVLNLRFNTTVHGNVPMTIIDMNGRAVRSEQVLISAGGNNVQVAVSDLAPGLYMMCFGNDAKAVAFRFVKR